MRANARLNRGTLDRNVTLVLNYALGNRTLKISGAHIGIGRSRAGDIVNRAAVLLAVQHPVLFAGVDNGKTLRARCRAILG
jgi:hypothetical protein